MQLVECVVCCRLLPKRCRAAASKKLSCFPLGEGFGFGSGLSDKMDVMRLKPKGFIRASTSKAEYECDIYGPNAVGLYLHYGQK